jgi:radical SAM superfamily enzyme YgiQ (UPF0313 family)
MRALLVNPVFPNSYWSGKYALPFARRRSILPPLSLITVAALLPDSWDLRLIDLNVENLTDRDLRSADVVMLTGMVVQRESLQEVLARCRELGVRTVVGGPYTSSLPEELADADHLVIGEGEGVVEVLAADLERGEAKPVYRESDKPEMSETPVPRYDLLRPGAYHHMSLQYSRGCPFNCEFCDIIVLYGRKPRVKSPQQVTRELDAIRATGFRGDVFFVDDNFIGNRKTVKNMLPHLAEWRRRNGAGMEFYTEATINLADDPKLVKMMTEAGFTAVFIGIESPSDEALKETGKIQNLRRNLVAQVHDLVERGIDVYAGFILGFDSDGPDIFDRMIDFVGRAGIPYAMVGMLSAPPNTPLHARLEDQGRLRDEVWGDQFGLTNVITMLPTAEMLAGYRKVLETLYHPEMFFQRCRDHLSRWAPQAGQRRPLRLHDLFSGIRAIWNQGFRQRYRRTYWKFLRWVVRHHPRKLGKAIQTGAVGHHYITYTNKIVVPALLEKAKACLAERMRGVDAPAEAEA